MPPSPSSRTSAGIASSAPPPSAGSARSPGGTSTPSRSARLTRIAAGTRIIPSLSGSGYAAAKSRWTPSGSAAPGRIPSTWRAAASRTLALSSALPASGGASGGGASAAGTSVRARSRSTAAAPPAARAPAESCRERTSAQREATSSGFSGSGLPVLKADASRSLSSLTTTCEARRLSDSACRDRDSSSTATTSSMSALPACNRDLSRASRPAISTSTRLMVVWSITMISPTCIEASSRSCLAVRPCPTASICSVGARRSRLPASAAGTSAGACRGQVSRATRRASAVSKRRWIWNSRAVTSSRSGSSDSARGSSRTSRSRTSSCRARMVCVSVCMASNSARSEATRSGSTTSDCTKDSSWATMSRVLFCNTSLQV